MSKETITEIKQLIKMIQSDIRAAQTCISNIEVEEIGPMGRNKVLAAFNYNEKALKGLNKLYESQD